MAEFNLFTQFQVMELKIVDEKNREVPRVLLFADPSPSELSRPIGEKLANNYVQLRPRMIHGFRVHGQITLRPQRYRLTAIYREL
ncbi:hypothetical protein WAJ75_20850, partial [Acinetobacter baumannii]